MDDDFKKYLAEFFATFAFVFAGTGAIVVDAQTGALGHLGIALVFGFTLAVMIYATGHISGGHVNPAVTLGFWFAKKIKGKLVIPYIVSQLLGATLASFLVLNILGNNAGLGVTLPAGGISQSFYLEIVMTFFLMFVIISVAADKKAFNQFGGLAIGTTVALDALFGGPISGASMNPARSFGPALVSGNFGFHWIYWVAPIIGALIAVYAYKLIESKK